MRRGRPAGIALGVLLAVVCFSRLRLFSPGSVAHAQSEASMAARAKSGYAVPEACTGCHQKVWETYRQTGMGRSFSRPSVQNTVEDYTRNNTFYHKASDSYFTMLQRDGNYYQRRHQIDAAGKQINVVEKRIDYILGSGNHSRAYLHRTDRNTLIELPLAWYSEKGGYWAMNPGYDRLHHDGFRRAISYDCMFCHNGYPKIPAAHERPFTEPVYEEPLPEGIDCQRCHGPGSQHVRLARMGSAKPEEIRRSIVNPSRLSAERQMEVCMQCHLETTSFPLPNAIQRYERGPFSYRAGEPLSGFLLFFDHAAGKGRDEKFEIVNAAYRLRRSQCFRQSKGELRCTTCHDPHNIPRGEEANRHYDAVCRNCHSSAFDRLVSAGKHSRATGCTGCHMPKRRTEDVVHVVATDHFIQRRKPVGDLLADILERHETEDDAYRGEVVLYYPEKLPRTPENELFLALAQVLEKSNLSEGIKRLTAAIERSSPKRSEYYFSLAEALRNNGEFAKALPFYREAVRRDPTFAVGWQKLGSALRRSGQYAEAAEAVNRAAAAAPNNASTWHELGLVYRAQGNLRDAVAALERAIALDPDLAEAHNNLGILWATEGQQARAEAAFREAIRNQPDYADAHGNLANLLSGAGDFMQARDHFETALRLRPNDAATRYNYAMALGRARQFDAAQLQLEASLRAAPELADAHQLLANLLMAKGQMQAALPHYREVVRLRPESERAHLGLGSALVAVGDRTAAITHLQKAASAPDPAIREEAAQLLQQLGRGR